MNVLIRSAVCEVLLLMAPDGWVEEPVTPIGFLLINPTAMHRKALKLAGVTHNVAAYSKTERSRNSCIAVQTLN